MCFRGCYGVTEDQLTAAGIPSVDEDGQEIERTEEDQREIDEAFDRRPLHRARAIDITSESHQIYRERLLEEKEQADREKEERMEAARQQKEEKEAEKEVKKAEREAKQRRKAALLELKARLPSPSSVQERAFEIETANKRFKKKGEDVYRCAACRSLYDAWVLAVGEAKQLFLEEVGQEHEVTFAKHDKKNLSWKGCSYDCGAWWCAECAQDGEPTNIESHEVACDHKPSPSAPASSSTKNKKRKREREAE